MPTAYPAPPPGNERELWYEEDDDDEEEQDPELQAAYEASCRSHVDDEVRR